MSHDFDSTILFDDEPEATRSRTPIIAVASLATVAVLGGGAYFGGQFLSGSGIDMAQALPANTLAFVEIDTDPSASQKVEAFKTLNKWPELKAQLGGEDADLREKAFDELIAGTSCEGELTYDKDVKPWIGTGAALAAVPFEDTLAPLVVFSVTDADKAKEFAGKVTCLGETTDDPGAPAPPIPNNTGFMVSGDYMYASGGGVEAGSTPKDILTTITGNVTKGDLSTDATYQKWSKKPGDRGVINFYVSPALPEQAAKMAQDESGQDLGAIAAAKDFAGAAGVVRFSDGGVEVEVVGDMGPSMAGAKKLGDAVTDLPDDTAAVLAFGTPDNAAKNIVDGIAGTLGMFGMDEASLERESGMDLPEDLQTLLGDAVVASVSGKAISAETMSMLPVDAGVSIHGDADKIAAVVAKIEERTGWSLAESGLQGVSNDGVWRLASGTYGDELAKGGDLGGKDAFSGVVDDASDAAGIVFMDFNAPLFTEDAGAGMFGEVNKDVEPLEALGISVTVDGSEARALFRLTTD